jgi:excisionase family DNA binding protein
MNNSLLPEVRHQISVSNRFYTIADLAEVTGVRESSLYDYARQGRITGMVRIGRHIRFDKAKIDAWLDAGGELSDS